MLLHHDILECLRQQLATCSDDYIARDDFNYMVEHDTLVRWRLSWDEEIENLRNPPPGHHWLTYVRWTPPPARRLWKHVVHMPVIYRPDDDPNLRRYTTRSLVS